MANEKRLIDAYALFDTEERRYKSARAEFRGVLSRVLDDIADAPTVDAVEVVHGRWFRRQFADDMTTAYRCSECNTTWDADTNYCPNCGAKMDGDGNA